MPLHGDEELTARGAAMAWLKAHPEADMSSDDLCLDDAEIPEGGADEGGVAGEGPTQPEDLHWTIVHMPTHIAHLINRGYLSEEVGILNMEELRSSAPLRVTFGRELREAWLRNNVPPGAAMWLETPNFQSFFANTGISPIKPADWLVMRGTPLYSNKYRGAKWSSDLPYLRSAGRALGMNVLLKFPAYNRLLFIAIREALASTNAWEDWGLAWVPEGLYFNHRIAMLTVKTGSLRERFTYDQRERCEGYSQMFPEITASGEAPWDSKPALLHQECKYMRRISVVSIAADDPGTIRTLKRTLAPYERVLDKERRFIDSFDNEWDYKYGRIFKIAYKAQSTDSIGALIRDVESKSVEFWENETRPLAINARYNPSDGSTAAQRSAKSAREARQFNKLTHGLTIHRKIRPLMHTSICMKTLDWVPDPKIYEGPFKAFHIPIVPHAGIHYVGVPLQVAAIFPELADPEVYKLPAAYADSDRKTYLPYIAASTRIAVDLSALIRTHPADGRPRIWSPKVEDEHTYNPLAARRQLYLHPELLQYPYGEFWRAVTLFRPDAKDQKAGLASLAGLAGIGGPTGLGAPSAPPDTTDLSVFPTHKPYARYNEMLRAWAKVCIWLHDPSGASVPPQVLYSVGPELQYLTDPNSGCPVQTPSLEQRLEFLYAKAECLHAIREEKQRLKVANDGDKKPYAKRMGVYEQWVIWYVKYFEALQLDVRLNGNQFAEYLQRRWMPWLRLKSFQTHRANLRMLMTKRRPSDDYLFEKISEEALNSMTERTRKSFIEQRENKCAELEKRIPDIGKNANIAEFTEQMNRKLGDTFVIDGESDVEIVGLPEKFKHLAQFWGSDADETPTT